MPQSTSAFPKLCSPCDVNLSTPAAGSEPVLASSRSLYSSRTPRESDRPCRVSGPFPLGAALDQRDECCQSGGSGIGLLLSGV
jgi:hypothetical protein